MSTPEFSRIIKIKAIAGTPLVLEADAAERAALAARFSIVAIGSLKATVSLEQRGHDVIATGNLAAQITQACAVSGEDFPHAIEEPIALRFVPSGSPVEDEDMEIELESEELDEIEYDGESFDLGEAVAQSLGLSIDPYAEGPNADAARQAAGITSDDAPRGPLADLLSALKKN